MRFTLLALLILSGSAIAQEVKTNFSSIDLPEKFRVETDGESRLVAVSSGDPNSIPYLIIEFGLNGEPEQLLKRISKKLNHSGRGFERVPCAPSCSAFYMETSEEIDNTLVFRHHYFVRSEKLTFFIAYLDNQSMAVGRRFIKSLADQILKTIVDDSQ